MRGGCVFLLSVLLVSLSSVCDGQEPQTFPFLMPDIVPEKADDYWCTSLRLDPKTPFYITAFVPNATMDVAHHMIISTCPTTRDSSQLFNCGGPMGGSRCRKTDRIIYAWARDAPKLTLPEAVGFKVGGGGEEEHLVLQVHYSSVEKFKDGGTDNSGVILEFTKTPQKKNAGVIILGTGGRILPKSTEFMEVTCSIHEDVTIHPFAFRTHTHSLGRVVSGYKVNETPGEKWTLIGKKDPQLPQMFYPTMNDVTISQGDRIAARCTMQSDRDRVTRTGATNEDEMCNFYIMYWKESEISGEELRPHCFSSGPPSYYWNNEGYINVPEDASTLPAGETSDQIQLF